MVKAVAVLGNSSGVSGTIYFTQEADGNLKNPVWSSRKCKLLLFLFKIIILLQNIQAQLQWLEMFLVLSLGSMGSMSMHLGTQQMVACQLV